MSDSKTAVKKKMIFRKGGGDGVAFIPPETFFPLHERYSLNSFAISVGYETILHSILTSPIPDLITFVLIISLNISQSFLDWFAHFSILYE